MKEFSERRLAENELLFRHNNSKKKYQVQKDAMEDEPIIDFYCECSDRSCHERIYLTPETYEALHQNNKQFIALLGHENTAIEEVIKLEGEVNVIQKFIDPSEIIRESY